MAMDLHLDLKAPWVPDIGVRFVPKAEKQAAEAFYHNLYELQKMVRRLRILTGPLRLRSVTATRRLRPYQSDEALEHDGRP